MDRCALFIDAGYLLAAGSVLTSGRPSRSGSECDVPELVAGLRSEVELHGQLPLMRAYWYDAAPLAVPTTEHACIGKLRGVKLRLGRLSSGRQKGVDALIYRDMMTLARERALVRAYLLSGDDDLREGMLAAQDMGVEVVLLGIPAVRGGNQAESLVMEADEHLVLPPVFWRRYFRVAPTAPTAPPIQGSESTQGVAGPPTPAAEAAVVRPAAMVRHEESGGEAPPSPLEQDARAAGSQFGTEWATRAGAAGLDELIKARPRIPPKLDLQLLLFVESAAGALKGRQSLRKAARAGFWRALKERRRAVAGGSPLTGRGSLFDSNQPCGEVVYHLTIVEPRQDSAAGSLAAVVQGHLEPQGGQRIGDIVGRPLTLRLEDGRRLDLVVQDRTGKIRPGERGLYQAGDAASRTADEIHGRVLRDSRERDLDAVASTLSERCWAAVLAAVTAFQSRGVLANNSEVLKRNTNGPVIGLENGSGYRGATTSTSAFQYALRLSHDQRAQVSGWCQVEIPEASMEDPPLRLRWVAQYPEGRPPRELFRVPCSVVQAGDERLDQHLGPHVQALVDGLLEELNTQDREHRGL